ncbi:MAG TPA: prepilin-type N-terminal cleavage/methylation domain-containing protein [Ruminococcus sp.]|nr:prepilin-type N-terminal cleavage/methylation domain-containing protein [Ruminococcus sp.]
MKKRKGFTLTELIIVLAIIAILSAIIFPSWSYIMGRARMKSQNNNSKVVFNAAQTAAIKLNFQERKIKEEDKKFMGSGEFILYWDGGKATAFKGTDVSKLAESPEATALATQINNVFSGADETVYKIYINNYIVQSVASGRNDNDRYPGSYPTTTLQMDKDQREDISDGGIKSAPMGQFMLTPVAPPADDEGEGEGEGT